MSQHEITAVKKLDVDFGLMARSYSTVTRGASIYIVNGQGVVVSKGYHSIEVFRHRNTLAIIGRMGAMSNVLRFPDSEDALFTESPVSFHELRFDDALGLLIAKTGALSYVVDLITGTYATKGYHSFEIRCGKLFGILGSTEEAIAPVPRLK